MKKFFLIIMFTLALTGAASAQKFELKNCVNINWGEDNRFNYYYNQNLKKIILETINDYKTIIKTEEIKVIRTDYGIDNSFIVLARNDDFTFWLLQKEKLVIKARNRDLLLFKEKCS